MIIINILKILYYKLIYRGKIKVNLIQRLGNVKIKIINKGQVTIKSKCQSREMFSIISDGGNVDIGAHCFFNRNCSITAMKKIFIGDYCSFGNNVVIVDHNHDIIHRGSYDKEEIIIGNNVWIGANCVILKGTIIGDNCVIAAGSVVKGKIDNNTILIQKRENTLKKVVK